jgi:hypothetical protein
MIAVRDFVNTLMLYAVAHLSHLNGCAQTSSAVWIQLTFRCSVQENWKEMMDLFRKDYSDICADNTKGWELLPVAMTTFETTRRKASIVGKIGQGAKQNAAANALCLEPAGKIRMLQYISITCVLPLATCLTINGSPSIWWCLQHFRDF